jgi:DNA-binding NarL/FixJ family response regulator
MDFGVTLGADRELQSYRARAHCTAVGADETSVPMIEAMADPRLRELTPRERDIVRGVVDGLSNREIARVCGVSDRTVRNRLTAIFEKLGVRSRTQLVGAVLRRSGTRTPGDR